MISIGDEGYYKNDAATIVDIHTIFPRILISVNDIYIWIKPEDFLNNTKGE